MRPQVDEEFAGYVRARQHGLLRAAYLVCGERRLAEDLLLGAFVRLAHRWERLRTDDPDVHVRRTLYREAMSAWRRNRRDSFARVLPASDDADRTHAGGGLVELERALASLTPRQRAVVVLRCFEQRNDEHSAEVLGVAPETVGDQSRAALARLRDRVPGLVPTAGGPGLAEGELGDLLDRATADLPEVDFAEDAWAGAIAARARRRRSVLQAVGAMAAAGVAVAAVNLAGGDRGPLPAPTPTTQRTTGALADRTRYAVMPLEGREGDLRQYDVGLPSRIVPSGPLTPLSTLATPLEPVVAVYVRAEGARYQPVLVTRTGRQVLVDRLTLLPLPDVAGEPGSPLGPRAVGGGGRVAFAQPGEVVVLDSATGEVHRYAVPSSTVRSVGWTRSGGTLVIRSDTGAWTLDPWQPGATPVRADPQTYDGLFQVTSTDGAGSLDVVRHDDSGSPTTRRSVPTPVTEVWGETVGSEDLAASGVFYDQNLTSPLIERGNGPIYQGLVVLGADQGAAMVLVAPESPDGETGRFMRCCLVLGWADATTVLFQSLGAHGSWVLAWDVRTGEVFKVMRVESNPARAPIPRLALNVGSRY